MVRGVESLRWTSRLNTRWSVWVCRSTTARGGVAGAEPGAEPAATGADTTCRAAPNHGSKSRSVESGEIGWEKWPNSWKFWKFFKCYVLLLQD